jgi:RimJ/RimL family protein N-acetyltransferase
MTIALAPFGREDFDRLIAWIPTAEDLMLWSGPYFTFPLEHAQLESYLRSAEGDPPPRQIYKALIRESGEVVGHIELNNIDYRNRAATISKVLVGDPGKRGRGLGEQMVRCVMEIAFDDLRLHRLSLIVFDFNQAAIRCYQKLGFTIEGHLRDYRKVGDTYWSSYTMAILESDWRRSFAETRE